jgi:hypothetical protein
VGTIEYLRRTDGCSYKRKLSGGKPFDALARVVEPTGASGARGEQFAQQVLSIVLRD